MRPRDFEGSQGGARPRWLPLLGLLALTGSGACGGRVGSQSEGGSPAHAGQTGSGGSQVNPPGCCDPPIVTCFAAGTRIATPAGPVPIEQIEVGQQVLGYDENRGELVARPVTARLQHSDVVVGQLVLGDGRTIVTTPDHPFFVPGEASYRPAAEIRSGTQLLALTNADRLMNATATGYFVTTAPVQLPVFNITVADVHNYFAEGVLVHNKSPPDPCEGLAPARESRDLVGLTGAEHALSVSILTSLPSEPFEGGNTASYHGQRLPASAYPLPALEAIAQAAKAAGASALANARCAADTAQPEQCGRDFIESFVTRTYRRPLAESERARYFQLFGEALAGADLAAALGTVVEAALQSPHFLYKVEVSQGPQISELELATRLSYFLTGGPPDLELMERAGAGALQQSLEAEVERLRASPQFPSAMAELYGAWLGLDRLRPEGGAPAELVRAMRAETQGLFRWHASTNAPVTALLTEPITFLDAPLAEHYGLPIPVGAGLRVELDPTRYAGALTQGSFMTAFPSLTRRGAWILDRLLCNGPPPPPLDVTLPPPPGPGEDRRAWIEAATADPPCRACHQLMDPIGFAFASFDELGRWQQANDAGSLDLDGQETPVTGAAELASVLSSRSEVRECITGHWMAWALKRPLDEYETCRMKELSNDLPPRATVADLLEHIAVSDVFRSRTNQAASVDDSAVQPRPARPLSTEAERSTAARQLVEQELQALIERLPNDSGLLHHQQALASLPLP